jgi:hypothetical protein
MTPEQQRIAIAEACGWKLVMDNPLYEPYWEDTNGNIIGVSCGMRFPNYLNDLNAMHEAENVLTNEQWWLFVGFLTEIRGGGVALCISASAAQRAEAFLKTLNLWTNEARIQQ